MMGRQSPLRTYQGLVPPLDPHLLVLAAFGAVITEPELAREVLRQKGGGHQHQRPRFQPLSVKGRQNARSARLQSLRCLQSLPHLLGLGLAAPVAGANRPLQAEVLLLLLLWAGLQAGDNVGGRLECQMREKGRTDKMDSRPWDPES